MQSLAPHDRPREKLERLGPSGLGDNELLAVILGHGVRSASAIEVANRVLEAVRGVHGLTRQFQADLRCLKGIGAVKASQILAAVELGRRTLVRQPGRRVQLGSPRDVASYLLPGYGARPVEQLGIVLLDTKHRVLKTAVLSVGTLDASLVHPREVFREAAGGGAAAIGAVPQSSVRRPNTERRGRGADGTVGRGGAADGHRGGRPSGAGRREIL